MGNELHVGELREQVVSESLGGEGTELTDEEIKLHAKRGQWMRKARQYYDNSSDYLDSSIRNQWTDNLAHFRNEHAPGSKYSTEAYRNRSKVFRPKTRAMMRGQESSLAAALFTNSDLVAVDGANPNDAKQAAGARVCKALLQHRLEKSIPWFLTAMGAYQDTHNYGICISKQFWNYKEKIKTDIEPVTDDYGESVTDDEGMPLGEEAETVEILKDQPAIELMAPENFRFDPNADWRDPVSDSPFLIEMIPMYAGDVLSMMEREDRKTGMPEWHKYTLGQVLQSAASNSRDEATRQAREGQNRTDPVDVENGNEFTTVWVHFNIVREDDEDLAYYTLGTHLLLTDPVPMEEIYVLGRETYRIGFSIVESHRNYPAGNNELASNLQEEINDITNQRLDNVRLVLNKRYFIRRQANLDLAALMRNVPGGGITVDNPREDVRVIDTPDVTGSSYNEQDRLSVEMDDLMGSFSQASVQSNRSLNETVGGMNQMSAAANQVQEYTIRTFIETWVEPVLRTLIKLEQYYETDETLLALAAQNAELFDRYGVDEVTDDLLDQELTVTLNVGMGNTDPTKRVEKLNIGLQSVGQLPTVAARLNEEEIAKEVFSSLGFGDGARFLIPEGEEPAMDPNAQQPTGPDPAVEQANLELKREEMQADQQFKREKLASDDEYRMAQLELKMAELQEKFGIDGEKMGLESMKVQTARDTAALKETNKTRELNIKERMGSGI